MKILHVSTAYKPSFETGGVVRVIYEISKCLSEMGHDVTVYTTDRGTKRVKVNKKLPVDIDGVKVYYFKNISNKLSIKRKIITPYGAPFLARKEINKFDKIHVHEHRTVLAAMCIYYAKKFGIPYVVQAHGSLPYNGKTILKKTFDRFYGFDLLQSASKCIALNETEKQQYIELGVDKNKIEIIPNGISLSEYENLPDRGIFRRKYEIRDDEKIILFLGRIHKIKGLDLLVSAFSDLVKRKDNIKLVIVGPDDGYLTSLKRQLDNLALNGKVLLTGPLYGIDKLSAFIDADVFVLPSIYEIFGITMFEAMACGTPVICSKGCLISSIIHNQTGLAFENNKNKLGEAISNILGNEKKRKQFVENGKDMVNQKFNWEKITKKIDTTYEEIISSAYQTRGDEYERKKSKSI